MVILPYLSAGAPEISRRDDIIEAVAALRYKAHTLEFDGHALPWAVLTKGQQATYLADAARFIDEVITDEPK